jgi:hypothetical protein
MKKDTSMEHKEVVVVCEKNGPINLSCNVLLTTSETNTLIKHVVYVALAEPSI